MNKTYVIVSVLVLALLPIAWKSFDQHKSAKPVRVIDREMSEIRAIPFVILPGEENRETFKVFRTFEDGSKELFVFSIVFEKYEDKAYVFYSAQGKLGGSGDDHEIGADFQPKHKNYTLPGVNSENTEYYYLKMNAYNTDQPVRGTLYLHGKNRYTQYPDGRRVPLRWE